MSGVHTRTHFGLLERDGFTVRSGLSITGDSGGQPFRGVRSESDKSVRIDTYWEMDGTFGPQRAIRLGCSILDLTRTWTVVDEGVEAELAPDMIEAYYNGDKRSRGSELTTELKAELLEKPDEVDLDSPLWINMYGSNGFMLWRSPHLTEARERNWMTFSWIRPTDATSESQEPIISLLVQAHAQSQPGSITQYLGKFIQTRLNY